MPLVPVASLPDIDDEVSVALLLLRVRFDRDIVDESVVLPLPIVLEPLVPDPIDEPLVPELVEPDGVVPVPGDVMPESVVVVEVGEPGAPELIDPVEPVPLEPVVP